MTGIYPTEKQSQTKYLREIAKQLKIRNLIEMSKIGKMERPYHFKEAKELMNK